MTSYSLNVHEWFWGVTQKNKWLPLLGETLLIAYIGTITGAVGAFFWCFLASQNLVASRWLRLSARRYLEFCRTVPELVFALIFVVAFHLGLCRAFWLWRSTPRARSANYSPKSSRTSI